MSKNLLSSRFRSNVEPVTANVIDTVFQEQKSENCFADLIESIKDSLLKKIDSIPVWSEYPKNRQIELINSFIDTKAYDISESEKKDLIESFN